MTPPRRKPDVVIDPGRQTLHRLLDEILDRRPDLQVQMLKVLRQTMTHLEHPDAVVGMQVLSAAKRVLDALAEHRAAR
jgi:hypothetical protein